MMPVEARIVAPEAATPGRRVYTILQGSHAYGLATPESDHDWRGVFLLPNSSFLGLYPDPTKWENKATDQVFWELGHFCRLLLKGNPNIVSMLSAPLDCVYLEHLLMYDLIEMRSRLVSQSLRSAYVGWVHDEMRRVHASQHGPEGRPRGQSKRLSHVPRLIWEYVEAVEDGVIPGRIRPERLEIVRQIKSGEMPYEQAFDEVAQMVLDLEEFDARNGPALPEAPVAEIREWLVAARRRWGDG